MSFSFDTLDNNRKMLISLLSAALGDKRPDLTGIGDVTWQIVFDEAAKHQVAPLVYPVIENACINFGIPKKVREKWRLNTLFQSREQERNYLGIGKVLERLSNSGIPVIALKGLVLRDLYPDSSLRTMGDVDLLVKPGDVESAGRILALEGYKLYSGKGMHTEYLHRYLPNIELHESLLPDGNFIKSPDFEAAVWNRAIPVNISNAGILSLCPRDNAVYLCVHMAKHIINSGFGLRQLCDFVLLIENYREEINWTEFFQTISLLHIDAFVKAILEVCYILFGLKIPQTYLHSDSRDDDILIGDFIEDIFNSGVFGLNSMERITANRLLYYNSCNELESTWQRFCGFVSMILPSADKLDTRYNYARAVCLLLPIAWVHRIIYSFVRRDMSFAEKKAIILTKHLTDIYSSRKTLLIKLGLLDYEL